MFLFKVNRVGTLDPCRTSLSALLKTDQYLPDKDHAAALEEEEEEEGEKECQTGFSLAKRKPPWASRENILRFGLRIDFHTFGKNSGDQ